MKRLNLLTLLTGCIVLVVGAGVALLVIFVSDPIIRYAGAGGLTVAGILFLSLFSLGIYRSIREEARELSGRLYDGSYRIAGTSLLSGLEQTRRTLISSLDSLQNYNSEIMINSDVLENTFEYFVEVINEILNVLSSISGDMQKQKEAVQATSAAVVEMVSAISSVSSNTDSQSSSVIQLSSTIEEMTASINTIAGTTEMATEVSGRLAQEAGEGQESIEETIASIKDIRGFSTQISEIVNVISNISGQTDLLAMNAAIEAAHAGEAGKGFAVVADEIRKLAETSSTSAKQISALIKNVTDKIEVSAVSGEAIGNIFNCILDDIEQTKNIIAEIANAVKEQSVGSKEILEATENLVKITDEIKDSMDEQREANNEINKVVTNLEDAAQSVVELTDSTREKQYLLLDAVNRLGKVSVRNYDVGYRLRNKITFASVHNQEK